MEARLCNTPVTGDYIAQHMKASLGQHAILKSISNARKIGLRQGFLSNILRLELTWENEQDHILPKSVVIKVPTFESMNGLLRSADSTDTDELKATMAEGIVEVHKGECDFYELLGNEAPCLMPKCYVALRVGDDGPGMIILEDLSDKGMIANSVAHGLTYNQTISAVTELARLHAWSLITPIDWRTTIPQLGHREAMMRGFLTSMPEGLEQVKVKYPAEFGDIEVEKLVRFVSYDYFREVTTRVHRKFMDDVLVHGDFHMNNMLFERMPDGSSGDKLVALLDFQGVSRGSPGFDLARLVCFSVPEQIRRTHEQDIVRHYFDSVKSIAGAKFTSTLEQFRQCYESSVVFSAMAMVASAPMLINAVANSDDGEEMDAEKMIMLRRIKAIYEDSMKILGCA